MAARNCIVSINVTVCTFAKKAITVDNYYYAYSFAVFPECFKFIVCIFNEILILSYNIVTWKIEETAVAT
jgi:hypothetical protein